MLGIQTHGRRKVGADETTELWPMVLGLKLPKDHALPSAFVYNQSWGRKKWKAVLMHIKLNWYCSVVTRRRRWPKKFTTIFAFEFNYREEIFSNNVKPNCLVREEVITEQRRLRRRRHYLINRLVKTFAARRKFGRITTTTSKIKRIIY